MWCVEGGFSHEKWQEKLKNQNRWKKRGKMTQLPFQLRRDYNHIPYTQLIFKLIISIISVSDRDSVDDSDTEWGNIG